jgi:hypothetical protein
MTTSPRPVGSHAPLRPILIPWYPIAFVATYVLNLWIEAGVSVLAVTRSLAIAVVGAALLLVLLSVLSRRPHLAGLITLGAILVLLSRGPVYIAALIVLVVAATLAALLWGRIRRRSITWPEVTRSLNVVSGLLLVVVVLNGVPRGTLGAVMIDLQQGRSTLEESSDVPSTDLPSIYILMLDGYPRADSLARLFGADNTPFLHELRDRGFMVADRSRSNYMFTQLTLTSMLHMKPLSEITSLQPAAAGEAPSDALTREVLNRNPVFEMLRSQGYRIVTSSPGFEHVALRQSDVYLDDGQMNDFEYHLLRFTTAQRIVNLVDPDFFADQLRDRILSGFDHFADVTASTGVPTLGFVHVPSPHLPVVFAEDGSDAELAPSEDIFDWPEIDPVTRDAYARQLDYLNAEILDVVDHALASQPPGAEPIIILMSDHGAAPRPAVFIGEGTDDHYASFFAARAPGAADLFGDDVSPINVFPRLLNAYLGADLEEWPNERYHGVGGR